MKSKKNITVFSEVEILDLLICNKKAVSVIGANKKNEMLGYYLFDVSINNPVEESQYLINWNNKLNISDVDMHILEE